MQSKLVVVNDNGKQYKKLTRINYSSNSKHRMEVYILVSVIWQRKLRMDCVLNVTLDFTLLMESSAILVIIDHLTLSMLQLIFSFIRKSISFMISIFISVGIIVIIIKSIRWSIISNLKPFKNVRISLILY
jgi:hypothetical protein